MTHAITQSQTNILRRIGAAVDELALRSEAAGRSIDASREHRRRLADRIQKIERDLGHPQIPGDLTAAAELQQLKQQHRGLNEQIAAAKRQEEETYEQRQRLAAYLAPWRQTLEAVLGYLRISHEDIGIAYGEDVGRMVKTDVVVGGGAQ